MLNLIRNTVSNFRLTKAKQDANNFLAAAGITGQVQSQAIYNLVNDLQTSGLWSKMKAVYPMVTDNYNLLSYSEDFSNAVWTKVNANVTANSIIAPNGTNTADTITSTINGTYAFVSQDLPTLTNGQVYTVSRYVKAGNINFCTIGLHQLADAFFDLQNLTYSFSGTGAVSASITDVGNGWRRISATYTWSGSTYKVYFSIASSLSNYAGVSIGSYQYTWGAQLELGNTLSTYQPIATTPSAFMASQMKYNLKDARDLDAAFRLTWSGGWTYSATGATPNGTNGYANTNLNPKTSLTFANTHISVYSRTNIGVIANDIGVSDGGVTFLPIYAMAIRFVNNTAQYDAYDFNTHRLTPTNSDSTGLFIGNVLNSTNQKIYKNNSILSSNTLSQTELNLPNYNIYLATRNDANTPSTYTSRQYAFSSIGDGLTDTEAQLLNQIVEKYQVALSRGVQAAQSFYYNSAYSNEANTYLYSTQITGTTQVSAINTLINGLKANNLWTKMKAVYPFVTDKINLIGYTEDFANAYWGKISLTATLSGSYNNSNFFKLADSVNGSNSFLFYVTSLTTSSTVYTASANFKKGEYDYAQIHPSGSNGAVFNLANGTIVSNAVTNATITDIGSGWYRCSITYTASGPNVHFSPNKTSTSTYNYSGTIGSGIFMQSPQVEVGTNVTTYQPVLAANNYATNVAAQMKFNLVNPQDSDAAFRLAFSGGWTYSTNGAQPNGTNGYADTFLIPNTSLSTSSSHLSFYSRTNTTSGTGYELARTHYALITQFSGNTFYANLETVGSYAASYTSTNGLGHFIASRINNTTTQGFKNGLKVINASQNSSLATSSLIISNNGGANYSNKQTAFVSIGDGFTDAEAALLYSLVQQYQTELSRQV